MNGSDVLIGMGGKAMGGCTSHTTNYNSETKEIIVKPTADKPISSGTWTRQTVVKQTITISVEGLQSYDETETGVKGILKAWKEGKPVELKGFERESDDQPYLVGNFIVKTMTRTSPANDTATYSAELVNDGEPSVLDETKITENVPGA